MVTSEPTLLLYKGKLLPEVMKKERITVEEVNVAARKMGISQYEEIDFIVLETTGDITVIPKMTNENAETMKAVKKYPNL